MVMVGVRCVSNRDVVDDFSGGDDYVKESKILLVKNKFDCYRIAFPNIFGFLVGMLNHKKNQFHYLNAF